MDASSNASPSGRRPSRPSRPRRAPRIRIACARCHRRKIRCDAAMPSCGACQKAGVSCAYDAQFADGRQQRLADEDLAVRNSELEARVEWLESLLQQQGSPARTLRGGLSPQSLERPEASAGSGDGVASVGAVDEHAQIAVEPQGRIDATAGEHQTEPPPGEGTRSPQRRIDASATHGTLSHEVGLVSLSTGADPKYVGPSSGYFFTRLLGSGSNAREPNVHIAGDDDASSRRQNERSLALEICQDAEQPLPPSERKALQLSETYFSTIHVQYPFLHEPRHRQLVQEVYQSSAPSRIACFQVTMVISISAIILSRRSGVGLPASGWCAAAMAKFSDALLENSLEGLQALLLMSIYAMHSPSSPFNAWYINYQCIAMVLDLGLQRDVRATTSMSKLRREMRTRTFWVVYTLDRKLCTMMGRPIGIRDEACDLRMPADIDDQSLNNDASSSLMAHLVVPQGSPVTHMSYAIHLFQLARINSEIKYVLHSICRDTPSYAFPAIRDIGQWQETVLRRLESLRTQIPRSTEPRLEHAYHFCEMQHDAIKLLLLLPSPAIPRPGPDRLRGCYEVAVGAIKLFNRLDAQDILIHSWSTCHALILYSFCSLYCVAVIPQDTLNADRDSLAKDLRAALSVLSGIGEHWTGAKRTRHLLNELISVVLDTAPAGRRSAPGPNGQMTGPQSQYANPEDQTSFNINSSDQDQSFTLGAAGTSTGGTHADNIALGAQLGDDVFDTNYFELFGSDLFGGSSDLWNMFGDVLGPSGGLPNDIGMDWEKGFDP